MPNFALRRLTKRRHFRNPLLRNSKCLDIVQQLHDSPATLVYEFTGAGSLALFWLHSLPGSSRTILEATDRYSALSLQSLLEKTPEKFVSIETAHTMAKKAYQRALALCKSESESCLGVSCTASIATNRPKRGDHCSFVSIEGDESRVTYGLTLQKGRRTRLEEEFLISQLVLFGLASAGGFLTSVPLDLHEGEKIETFQ